MSTVIMFPNHEYITLRNGPSLPSFEWRLPASMGCKAKLGKELAADCDHGDCMFGLMSCQVI